jgi:hypothetical protein
MEANVKTPTPSKTLQGALIDVQFLASFNGPITKAEQMERLCRIREVVERAITENAKQAALQP